MKLGAYTRTLARAADASDPKVTEKAVTALIANLKRTGRMKLLPQLLGALRKETVRRKTLAPRVEVAHAKDAATALKEAAALGITAKEAQVNPALIRGWRALSGTTLVDHSAHRALIDIYKKITA